MTTKQTTGSRPAIVGRAELWPTRAPTKDIDAHLSHNMPRNHARRLPSVEIFRRRAREFKRWAKKNNLSIVSSYFVAEGESGRHVSGTAVSQFLEVYEPQTWVMPWETETGWRSGWCLAPPSLSQATMFFEAQAKPDLKPGERPKWLKAEPSVRGKDLWVWRLDESGRVY